MDVIYLDFQKAFDEVPNNRLLIKLKGYGIRGKLCTWIKDFLANRKQRVVVNGVHSDWRSVTSGIPQGSILGSILFRIFINDLPEVLSCLVKFYADDAKVVDNEVRLQANVNTAEQWAIIWKMFFMLKSANIWELEKASLLNHTPWQQIKEHIISNKNVWKRSGCYLRPKLIFRDHISKKATLANRNLSLIFKSFTYLDKDMFYVYINRKLGLT